MSGFSADWLSLREPFDLRARNPVALNALLGAVAGKPNLRIVDLACGTGSTLRALAPRLSAEQHWRLVDYDRALLARAAESAAAINVSVTTIAADLDRELEAVLAEPADLITTSALLDLVSEAWLDRLIDCAVARAVPVYAALSYDGRVELAPAHPLDEAIVQAVNLHQRRDKGFGPALGLSAAETALATFAQRGFSVAHGHSDWLASEQDAAFQSEIVRGWAAAAGEIGDIAAHDLGGWLAFRENEIAAGHSSLRVGHVDFFAVPHAEV
jgi:SAM-dependent methyltransferase